MKNKLILELPDDIAEKQPIVLFDGDCSLCNTSVRFLLKHNRSGNLNFASLQSVAGSRISQLAGEPIRQADTILLLQGNKLFSYSTAAIKTTEHLCFPWHLAGIFILVPPIIRDTLYRFIAENRYRWFGKELLCITDSEEYHKRFLS